MGLKHDLEQCLHQWQNFGAIAVNSIPKEETTFVVTLPLQAGRVAKLQ
ncbi:hypothetical protein [Nostoc sp.]